ncbi:MAG TPA: sigma-70 family RNA polymerase sigma factor [Solirubrobacterales bacterium]|nr:sigma-70 family RNA polymerase sigma factor [Solirubrobacterales bacterium]
MQDLPNRFSGSRQFDVPDLESEEQDSEMVREYIVKAQGGCSDAMRFLYVHYAPAVSRYVRRITRDDHEAEDITHDVFAKLMTAICKYEPREVPFAAWVMRVARNAAIDHLRTRHSIPCEEIRIQTEDRERMRRERRRDLEQALHQLPAEQRHVFVLRHIVGLSPLEIANLMDKTESSIHGLQHRGRVSMQSSLRQLGATPVVAAA